MKIPKYVDKLIKRRMQVAFELMSLSSKLDTWLEKTASI